MGPNKKITGNFALIAFLSTTTYPIVYFVLFFQKRDYHLSKRLLFSEFRACFEKMAVVQIQKQKKAIS